MKKIILTILLLSTLEAQARDILNTSIHKIDHPMDGENDIHVYLSDGSVVKLNEQSSQLFLDLESERMKNNLIDVKTDDKGYIKALSKSVINPGSSNVSGMNEYRPTVLSSDEDVKTIFKAMRKKPASWSQCYNRAHIWAYEAKEEFNLDSMKVFMFYTRKYIREYNFEWWFHVAPFTYVQNGQSREEWVLDGWFTKAPTKSEEWTEIFMKNKATCPVISKYSDYENHEEKEYCYLFKTSMYYLQPLDLDKLERTGEKKTEWNSYEVRRAYRNGFNVWF